MAEETREQAIKRLEEAGVIFPDCKECEVFYGESGPYAFAPRHKAMSSCKSGKRDHCTCETCF